LKKLERSISKGAYILRQYFFTPKFSYAKFIYAEIILRQKQLFTPKSLYAKKCIFLRQNNFFTPKTFFTPKNFFTPKTFFTPKNFFTPKIFRRNFFMIQILSYRIFFYKKHCYVIFNPNNLMHFSAVFFRKIIRLN